MAERKGSSARPNLRKFFDGMKVDEGESSSVSAEEPDPIPVLLERVPGEGSSPEPEPAPPVSIERGTHVGGQWLAGILTLAASAGGVIGGLHLLEAGVHAAWAAAAFGASALLAPVSFGFLLMSAQLGLAMADYIDKTDDPRDKDGDLKRLIRRGWFRKWAFGTAVGPGFESPALEELNGGAREVLRGHKRSRSRGRGGLLSYARQGLSHYGYLARQFLGALRGSRSIGALLSEMARGEVEIRPFLKPYRKGINLARGLLIAKAMVVTASAYTIGALTDAAISTDLHGVVFWLAALGGLTLTRSIIRKLYIWYSGVLRLRLRRDFRVHLFGHLLRMPLSFLAKENPARLAVRLTQDVSQLTVKNVSIPVQFPHHVIQLALAIGFVVASSWQLSLLLLSVVPLLSLMSWLYGRRAERYSELQMTRAAILTSTGDEMLNDARSIRAVSAVDDVSARYSKKADRLETVMLKQVRLSSNFNSTLEFLQNFISQIVVLGVGFLSHVLTGLPSVGEVVALRGYANQSRGAMDGVLNLYTASKSSQGSTKRVLSYLQQSPVTADKPGAADFRFGGGEIRFQGVSYQVPDAEAGLQEIDLSIGKGQKVLIVGDNANTRRAFVDLLLRLDVPGGGSVSVDGQDVAALRLKSLHDRMAYAQAQPIIVPGTLGENLFFGIDREIDGEEVTEAIRAAGAHFLLDQRRFPEGLETEIFARDFLEKELQRLALARAFLRRPEMVLLDGLGGGLDVRDRDSVLRGAKRLTSGKSTLLVNIPFDYWEEVDKVVLLKDGRIEDAGTPAELLERSERFRRMAGVADASKGSSGSR